MLTEEQANHALRTTQRATTEEPVAQQQESLLKQEIANQWEFVRVEKNLLQLGYFSVSDKIRPAEKVLSKTERTPEGTIETTIGISGDVRLGIPTTSDLSKYLAFMALVQDFVNEQGYLPRCLSFHSYQIMVRLGMTTGGKQYEEIRQWLSRMKRTTVVLRKKRISENGKTQIFGSEFNIFERIYWAGQTLDDGKQAEKNYVWFSQQHFDNLQANLSVPVNLELYKEIKTDIARALLPLAQMWLFASRREQVFRKNYGDLCRLLGIKEYSALSKIREKLGPALDHLKEKRYLASWDIITNGRNIKLLELRPGVRFYRDLELLRKNRTSGLYEANTATLPAALPPAQEDTLSVLSEAHQELLPALQQFGLSDTDARRLLCDLQEARPVAEIKRQLAYLNFVIGGNPAKYTNPAGYVYKFLTENYPVPEEFRHHEPTPEELAATAQVEAERRQQQDVELAYWLFCDELVAELWAALSEAERAALEATARRECEARWDTRPWTEQTKRNQIDRLVRETLGQQAPTLAEFAATRGHETEAILARYQAHLEQQQAAQKALVK